MNGIMVFGFGSTSNSADRVVKIDGSTKSLVTETYLNAFNHPNGDKYSVTSAPDLRRVDQWFAYFAGECINLEKCYVTFQGISNIITDNYVQIWTRAPGYFSGLFSKCVKLNDISNMSFGALPETITSMDDYFSETFYGCKALTRVPSIPYPPMGALRANNFMVRTFCNSGVTGTAFIPPCPEDAILMQSYCYRCYGNTNITGVNQIEGAYPWEWPWPTDPDPQMGNQCFANCTKLNGYSSIPVDWTLIPPEQQKLFDED
jgi:hypothetical protein